LENIELEFDNFLKNFNPACNTSHAEFIFLVFAKSKPLIRKSEDIFTQKWVKKWNDD